MRLLPLILTLLLTSAALAQPSTQPSTQPTGRPPDKTLSLPGVTEFHQFFPTTDGPHVWARVTAKRLNTWRLLVNRWPEITGALILLLTLPRLRKSFARRAEGEQCRLCGYSTNLLPSDICPECGTKLTPENRVTGRRHRNTAIAICTLLIVLLAGYAIFGRRLPRDGRLANWRDWPSETLRAFAEERNWNWLRPLIETRQDLILINAQTGRTELIRRYNGRADLAAITPDARRAYYLSDDGLWRGAWVPHYARTITERDVASDNITRKFTLPRTGNEEMRRIFFAPTLTPDRLWVVAEPEHLATESNCLVSWDFKTGQKKLDLPLNGWTNATFPPSGLYLRPASVILMPKNSAYEYPSEWSLADGTRIRTISNGHLTDPFGSSSLSGFIGPSYNLKYVSTYHDLTSPNSPKLMNYSYSIDIWDTADSLQRDSLAIPINSEFTHALPTPDGRFMLVRDPAKLNSLLVWHLHKTAP